MSQQASAALAPLPFELVLDDGEPLETEWHTLEYPLLRCSKSAGAELPRSERPPAERAERPWPRAEAEGRCPGKEKSSGSPRRRVHRL